MATRDNNRSYRWSELTRCRRRPRQDKQIALIGALIEQDTVVIEENMKRRSRRSHRHGYCIQRIELSRYYYRLRGKLKKSAAVCICGYLRVKMKFSYCWNHGSMISNQHNNNYSFASNRRKELKSFKLQAFFYTVAYSR